MAKKKAPEEVHEAVELHSKMFRDLMLGFVRVHVLHHASIEAIYGSGISAELEHHGYKLSWGTLYPLLHNLTAEGFLEREDHVVNGKVRKYYTITPLGRRALKEARLKALELVNEVVHEGDAEILEKRLTSG
ncbi:PadR family transcriptional regulator [Kribbella sp. NPDC049227]|uniref:PadR family transcriptional regulator n=1 Tax=Kribbella sp. NPDC049227 TaxID=3364113 RepID=UPI003719CA8B